MSKHTDSTQVGTSRVITLIHQTATIGVSLRHSTDISPISRPTSKVSNSTVIRHHCQQVCSCFSEPRQTNHKYPCTTTTPYEMTEFDTVVKRYLHLCLLLDSLLQVRTPQHENTPICQTKRDRVLNTTRTNTISSQFTSRTKYTRLNCSLSYALSP